MTATITVQDYQRIFDLERQQTYPAIDAFEAGFVLDQTKLEKAAFVLACPLKAHPPSWQHGRVLYAVVRRYLTNQPKPVLMLDIGTAKGFSALCLQWALMDSGNQGQVISVDVQHPKSDKPRNSVADLSGVHDLAGYLKPWPEASYIEFHHSSGVDWLKTHRERIHVAFVDGKHSEEAVRTEGTLMAERQQPGDVAIFDDVQMAGVASAVASLSKHYAIERLAAKPDRVYAIGVRK